MSNPPVLFDMSKSLPIADRSAPQPAASALQGAVSYASQRDPVKYAKLLDLHKRTGIAPEVALGNEEQVQQAADIHSIDYPKFAAANPRTTAWASDPGNAAVAGVDEIHRLAGMEQAAAGMRSTPSAWDTFKDNVTHLRQTFGGGSEGLGDYLTHPLEMLLGASTPAMDAAKEAGLQSAAKQTGDPFLQSVLALQQMERTPLAARIPVLSPAATAIFQRLLNPKSQNVFSRAVTGAAKGVVGLSTPENLGLIATLPLVPEEASSALSGAFSGQMAEGAAAGGLEAAKAAVRGQYGDSAEDAAGAGMSALFAAGSAHHALADHIGALVAAESADVTPSAPESFHGHLSRAVEAAAESKLRERAPDKFYEAQQANFAGDASLRIPAANFQEYFRSKQQDPAAVASSIGATNYAEAVLSGGDVEVPPADFLSKLDPDQQKELLPHIVDPETGLTPTQHAEGTEELQQWMAKGGMEQLQAEAAETDAESSARPEWQAVKEDLRQRYVEAGETPDVAEDLATNHANVLSNLARESGRTPAELLAMYNPRIVSAEAREGLTLYQAARRMGRDEEIDGADGSETTLLTPTREISAKYRLVEASMLQPSHDAHTFAINPNYPPNVQERAYDTSKEAQGRVIAQAQSYDPRYTVNTNPDAVNGPPVITPDGTVLGGNSRAMSTQRLYAADGSVYKQAVKEQAAVYGFTPEQVEAMDQPVLVRQIDHPENIVAARKLATELNKSMTGALGVSERAVSAGKNISPETIRNVSTMMQADDATLRETLGRHGADIVKLLVADGAITERERPQFVDAATGGLSDEGKSYVERALMGSVIDDPRLMDAAPKSVLNKLERSLGAITSFASRADEWNLLPAIREAVAELGAIQRAGSTVDLRLGQTSIFGDLRNPVVDAMVRALDGKPNAVREAFDQYSRDADQNVPGQSRMFGGGEAFDAFNAAFGSKLTEQEYHDGLTEAAATDILLAHGADPTGDEGLSEQSAGEQASRSARGSEHATSQAEAGSQQVAASEIPESEKRQQSEAPSGWGVAEAAGTRVEKRGWFRVLPDGSFEIGKTRLGDLSTFVHEPAHAYLEMLRDLVSREGASDALKSDYSKVLEFLGAKDGEELTRDQHEKWARANEQYLREGKAPSEGLRGVFQRFAVWLGSIYHKASDLGVELTPEIRDVMDRMYASEEGVNRAAREAGPQLFTSPEEAGWTEQEFQRYAEDNDVSVEAAKSHILGMLNEAALRDRTEAWREEEENVRRAMAEQVDARPEYKVIHGLRKGQLEDGTPLTLSKDSLVAQFGEDRVRKLQDLHPGLYRADGGADAEAAAEMHGFASAEDMMRTLESTVRRNRAIDQATRDYMTAKHGDIRFDGTLDDQARVALENNQRAEVLYRELRALKAKLADVEGKTEAQKKAMRDMALAPIEAYREAARQMVDRKAIADLQPTRYLDASRKYSREAFDAIRKGDAQAALDAKHKELMNHFLFREATEARKYVDRFEVYTQRALSKTVQGKLGLAGSDYQAQFNRLLFRYGLSRVPVEMPERSLAAWAADLYSRGMEPAIDAAMYNDARSVHYRQASIAEVRSLRDTLENIRHLAYQELQMEVHGRKVNFAEAVAKMAATARESLPTKPARVLKSNVTIGEKISDLVQRGDALLMRTERLMEWLDGGKTGPWHDNLWNLAADSQGHEYELQEQVTKALGDALERMPKEQRARMLDKLTVPGIGEPVTRHDLISMAFNLGNDGNVDRLQKTFLWHGWDPGAIHEIPKLLTREEWQFVQDGWDSLKPLGAAQAELERRLTGLPPVMVDPVPQHIELADGSSIDIAGGYYPIAMDPKYSARGAQQDVETTAQNLMESGYGRASTSRGNMQARTGFGGPMHLDYEQVLSQHTAKVIKDITHREFMLAANKLLLEPTVRKTLRDTLGEGYEEKMMPWLRTIVNDRNGSAVQGLSDLSRMMRGLRSNLTLATLSFKISTSLLQWTHAPRMLLSTNPGSYAQAIIDFLAHPAEMTEQIRQLSPNEMASRGDNLDRDIRAVLRGDPGIRRTVARAGNVSIKYTDHVLSFPLWLSVYRDALKRHVDLPEDRAQYLASHEADSAVRLGLGSGAPKDLPPIMRNDDMAKLFTMFYSFHNGIYGQLRDIGHQYRRGGGVGKLTYGLALSVLVPAVLSSLITGNGPKDDENKGAWAAKKALLFSADTIPMLRDAATAMDRDGDVKFTPLMDVLSKGVKATQQATSDDEDKDWTGIGLNYLEVGGDLGGVPGTTQAMKPLRYMHKVKLGEIDGPNAFDATVGSAPRR